MRSFFANPLGPMVRTFCASTIATLLALLAIGTAHGANLVVAHVGPYSGPAAMTGAEYGAGARLYFDYVNDQGGIYGARIVLAARDDAGDPERTRDRATELIRDKPIAFIGTVGVGNVNGLASVLETLQIPLVGPVVGVAGVEATRNRTVFHIQPNFHQEASALVNQLHSLGFRKIALCDNGGPSIAEAKIAAKEVGVWTAIEPIVIQHCKGAPPFAEAAAEAVIAARTQAVVFVGQTRPAADFITALRVKGSLAMVVTSSSVNADGLAAMLPADARSWLAVAKSFPNPSALGRPSSDSVVREFAKMRAAAESQMPLTRMSLAGFVSAKILVEAIRRAGANATSADVLKTLGEPGTYDVGGMSFDFSRDERGRVAYTRLDFIGSHGALLQRWRPNFAADQSWSAGAPHDR
jgi:ABC-type branched-subunit amino acid transport system substrate-binding protein